METSQGIGPILHFPTPQQCWRLVCTGTGACHPWVPHHPTAPIRSARVPLLSTPGQPPARAPETGGVVYPRAAASPPANNLDLYPQGGCSRA